MHCSRQLFLTLQAGRDLGLEVMDGWVGFIREQKKGMNWRSTSNATWNSFSKSSGWSRHLDPRDRMLQPSFDWEE